MRKRDVNLFSKGEEIEPLHKKKKGKENWIEREKKKTNGEGRVISK